MDPSFIAYRTAASYLVRKLGIEGLPTPQLGIICGSGLSELSNVLDGTTLTVDYRSIPGFPDKCTVAGHKGEVVFGLLSGVPTICFRGRFHSYEGHDMKTVVLPVYLMRCLGVKVLIVTNAAGGLNKDYNVGDVCVVDDHLAIPQLAGKNPLIGPNDDELGPRFPPTSNAYYEPLRLAAGQAALELGFDFVRPEGSCYCFVSGPMYESRAECRFLKSLGGDMVGMSTIPEVVAAHHCDLKVLCLSLITNKAIMEGHEGPVASHQEVLEAVKERSAKMQQLVKKIAEVLNRKILVELPDLAAVNLPVLFPLGPGLSWVQLSAVFLLGAIMTTLVVRK